MFSQFNNCKFERCAYTHDQDVKNNSNIDELNNEIIELKKSVKKVSESCPNETKNKDTSGGGKNSPIGNQKNFCVYQKVEQIK